MKYKFAPGSTIHRRRKATSWLALAALMLNLIVGGLLPSSMAGAAIPEAGRGEAFSTVVICTPNGLRTVKLNANGEPLPDQSSYYAFCVFCLPLNDGHSFVSSIQTTVLAPSLIRSREVIPLHISVTTSSVSLISRPTRAPPSFS